METSLAEKMVESEAEHSTITPDNQESDLDGHEGSNDGQVALVPLKEQIAPETRHIQLLEHGKIRPFNVLPDWISPSNLDIPVVVCLKDGYYCIEDYDKVLEAKKCNRDMIRCYVIEPSDNMKTELEIVLQKYSSRSATVAGKASYAELLRITLPTFKYLMNAREDLAVFSHGGRRKGNDFIGTRDWDALSLMASRMGKERDTVRKYIAHGRYLDKDTLDYLAEREDSKIGRRFFENIQDEKETKAKKFDAKGLTPTEIESKISCWVMDQYEIFKTNTDETLKKTVNKKSKIECNKKSEVEEKQEKMAETDGTQEDEQPETKGHVHHTPDKSSDSPSMNLDQVKEEMIQAIESSSQFADEIRQATITEEVEAKVVHFIEEWRNLLAKLRAVSTDEQQST
ncbi:hypothetical protein ACFL5K_03250 [Gemmatimonadota bacterium]